MSFAGRLSHGFLDELGFWGDLLNMFWRPRGLLIHRSRSQVFTTIVVLLCALSFFLVVAPGAAAPPPNLKKKLDSVLKTVSKTSPAWGVVVYNLDKDEYWYERNADKRLNLASNAKLITTAAALSEFGPNHEFQTHFVGDLNASGVIHGHLYVVGGADPGLLESDMKKMAQALKKKGVKEVRGGLRVDLGLFDDERLPPAFNQKKTDAAYRPNVEALSGLNNAVGVGFRPGASIGAPARVWLTPHNSYFEIANNTKTVKGKKEALVVSAVARGNKTRIQISGTIGVKGRRGSVRRRVVHPGLFAATVLRDALQKEGISFRDKSVATGAPPENGKRLYSYSSGTVFDHVKETNLVSNNMLAEMLFKALNARRGGPAASWKGARAVVESLLGKAGLPAGSYQFLNGSGLYRADFMTPRQMVKFLSWARTQTAWGAAFGDSLPVSGLSGTLKRRMRGNGVKGRVFAKTGTLNKVSTLSGYMKVKSGDTLVFSFLFNNIKTNVRSARQMQDRLCSALASF